MLTELLLFGIIILILLGQFYKKDTDKNTQRMINMVIANQLAKEIRSSEPGKATFHKIHEGHTSPQMISSSTPPESPEDEKFMQIGEDLPKPVEKNFINEKG